MRRTRLVGQVGDTAMTLAMALRWLGTGRALRRATEATAGVFTAAALAAEELGDALELVTVTEEETRAALERRKAWP